MWTHGSEWAIESGKDTDEDGWQYAFNVDTEHPWQPKLAAQHFVRRRRWTRSVGELCGVQILCVASQSQCTTRWPT